MNLKLLFFIMLNCIFLDTIAQGSIEGNIRDDHGEFIFSAYVSLYQDSSLITGTTTDFDGYFSLENISYGKYTLVISKVGFGTIKSHLNVNNRETLAYNKTLKKGLDIGVVEVIYTKESDFFIRSEPTVVIKKADDFLETGIKNPEKLISLAPNARQDKEGNISFRGSRPGQGAFYVDGMRLNGELDIPTASIYSIKIYNGGVPAAYGNTTSAVVVIDTKSYSNLFPF